MSFSFHFRAKTVPAAKAIADLEMDKVVRAQPVHAYDRASVLAAVEAQLSLLSWGALKGKHVTVSVSGSLNTRGTPIDYGTLPSAAALEEPFEIHGGNVSVSVHLIPEDATGDHHPALRD